ncbi:hypothetical protein Droror1_Dr00027511 [Drosera rotundifolia]
MSRGSLLCSDSPLLPVVSSPLRFSLFSMPPPFLILLVLGFSSGSGCVPMRYRVLLWQRLRLPLYVDESRLGRLMIFEAEALALGPVVVLKELGRCTEVGLLPLGEGDWA